MYQKLYSQIAAWRDGRPTILRTINRYSDWIGFTDAHLTHTQDLKTKTMLDAWDTMLCSAATANGFGCADIYHAFNGPAGTKAAAGLLGPDYTHPSQRGNDTIASVLEALGYAPFPDPAGRGSATPGSETSPAGRARAGSQAAVTAVRQGGCG